MTSTIEMMTGASGGGDIVATVGGWDDTTANILNRELSWLAFNARVLQLASDDQVPLLERLRFLAIFSSNLDEFFQVRVSGLWDQVAAGITVPTADGRDPQQQLAAIRDVVEQLSIAQQGHLRDEAAPALADEGIRLCSWEDLDEAEKRELADRFDERIFPVLTPLAVDPGHPFPYVSDLSLNLAVVMQGPDDGDDLFARVKVPNTLARWQPTGENGRLVPLEEIIAANLGSLFPGMVIKESSLFRVTRKADLSDALDDADDLLAAVEYELRRRRFGRATRLEVLTSASDDVISLLREEFDLDESAVYVTDGLIDMTSLHEVADLDRHALRWPQWYGTVNPRLRTEDGPTDFFAELRKGDLLVHHPYESFSRSVVEFIRQGATDPRVLAIKLTLYRTAGNSPIVDALITAAENGKQVAVLIELKARFDEAANIEWARRLEKAGVHVAYGLAGLKIHAKTAMVVREEDDGVRRYCHVGTGNYNHRTARVYEDFGLLTASPTVGADLASLFNHLTGYGRDVSYEQLLVAPEGLRSELYELIDREIASGRGRMILKMNALADREMIEKLYEASQGGVEIDLIVRGSCGLRPGVPGLSDRIRVRSIVGRHLEHSRVYYFGNAAGPGEAEVFIGSADLMGRNLNRRVETLIRVDGDDAKMRLGEVLDVLMSDDRLAWTLDRDGVWTKRRGPAAVDSHLRLQQLAKARAHG